MQAPGSVVSASMTLNTALDNAVLTPTNFVYCTDGINFNIASVSGTSVQCNVVVPAYGTASNIYLVFKDPCQTNPVTLSSLVSIYNFYSGNIVTVNSNIGITGISNTISITTAQSLPSSVISNVYCFYGGSTTVPASATGLGSTPIVSTGSNTFNCAIPSQTTEGAAKIQLYFKTTYDTIFVAASVAQFQLVGTRTLTFPASAVNAIASGTASINPSVAISGGTYTIPSPLLFWQLTDDNNSFSSPTTPIQLTGTSPYSVTISYMSPATRRLRFLLNLGPGTNYYPISSNFLYVIFLGVPFNINAIEAPAAQSGATTLLNITTASPSYTVNAPGAAYSYTCRIASMDTPAVFISSTQYACNATFSSVSSSNNVMINLVTSTGYTIGLTNAKTNYPSFSPASITMQTSVTNSIYGGQYPTGSNTDFIFQYNLSISPIMTMSTLKAMCKVVGSSTITLPNGYNPWLTTTVIDTANRYAKCSIPSSLVTSYGTIGVQLWYSSTVYNSTVSTFQMSTSLAVPFFAASGPIYFIGNSYQLSTTTVPVATGTTVNLAINHALSSSNPPDAYTTSRIVCWFGTSIITTTYSGPQNNYTCTVPTTTVGTFPLSLKINIGGPTNNYISISSTTLSVTIFDVIAISSVEPVTYPQNTAVDALIYLNKNYSTVVAGISSPSFQCNLGGTFFTAIYNSSLSTGSSAVFTCQGFKGSSSNSLSLYMNGANIIAVSYTYTFLQPVILLLNQQAFIRYTPSPSDQTMKFSVGNIPSSLSLTNFKCFVNITNGYKGVVTTYMVADIYGNVNANCTIPSTATASVSTVLVTLQYVSTINPSITITVTPTALTTYIVPDSSFAFVSGTPTIFAGNSSISFGVKLQVTIPSALWSQTYGIIDNFNTRTIVSLSTTDGSTFQTQSVFFSNIGILNITLYMDATYPTNPPVAPFVAGALAGANRYIPFNSPSSLSIAIVKSTTITNSLPESILQSTAFTTQQTTDPLYTPSYVYLSDLVSFDLLLFLLLL
jgi:hypothetical protein